MLNFNLIPKEKKEEIKKENFLIVILGILKSLILSLFIVFVVILNSYLILFYLSKSQNEIFERFKNDPKTKKIIALEEEIKSKNSIIDKIESAQLNIFYLAPPIEEIAELLPEGVSLQELSIERKVEGQSGEGSQSTTQPSEEVPSVKPSPTPSLQNQTQNQSQTQQPPKEYIEVNIKGTAKTREDVILLEERLKNREKKVEGKNYLFKNLSSTPANILKPTDTDFEFTFRLEKVS